MRTEMKDIFKTIISQLAERSTCDRAKVGCIITKDNRIIATGYNGSLPGTGHCDESGHFLVDDHCIRTVHAEMNSLMFCARNGINVEGCIVYITHSPCPLCTKLLVMAGIKKVYYLEQYKIDENPFIAYLPMEKLT